MVDLISDSEDGDKFEWDSYGGSEAGSLNTAGSSAQASSNLNTPGPSTLARMDSNVKKDSGAGPSAYMLNCFVGMGFSKELVSKAMMEAGDGGEDAILDLLLKYKLFANETGCDPLVDDHSFGNVPHTVDDDDDLLENWDDDGAGDNRNKDLNSDDSVDEEFMQEMSQMDKKIESLVSMGFAEGEARMAITRCGKDADISMLAGLICNSTGAGYHESYANHEDTGLNSFSSSGRRKRTKFMEEKKRKGKQFGGAAQGSGGPIDGSHDEPMPLPNPMVGFNLPGDRVRSVNRCLHKLAIGPPFFYYENVARAPKGVWGTMSSFLYDIQPEFVDSKFLCAAARKRGYIHNLPIENRSPLIPIPPKTIHDAFPRTKQWWPSWDTRRQFNCLQMCISSSKLTEEIRFALASSEDPPSLEVQKYVLNECRKWNLTWVGRNKVAPLEPGEIEFLLGLPKDHTRGISRTHRYKSLGNSFQVDTVAYHLSVLRDMFPNGMNVLSLFSGIGGAEVALHRLGIRMKMVVSVEKSEVNRTVLRTWWDQTQSGTLIEMVDIQTVTSDWLESIMRRIGGFDLVVGGSPCNNLSGSNHHHRNGLEGVHSSLFHHYVRILECVKSVMHRM